MQKKSPFLNAILALLYIIVVVSIMDYGTKNIPEKPVIIVPIAVLSLFTLSAAVMGYLFLGEPLQMYLSGEKKQGVKLFLQTVGVFAAMTAVALVIGFSGVVSM